jgi:TonB family protein
MRVIGILLILFSLSVKAQEPYLKEGLDDFVNKNTVYPPYSLHNCIQGTIKVAFKLNAKGDVHEAKVTDGLGIDLDEEALRLIKMSSGKWNVPQTHDTTTVLMVPVNFKLSGYGCEQKTNAQIALAIQAYKNEEEMVEVVRNFYQNKEKGNANADSEAKILRLKEDLGIDEAYLEQRIEVGMKKFKQGDQQGACKEFNFVKNMGYSKADELIAKYCN